MATKIMSMQAPQRGPFLPPVDKATFHRLVDDAIRKQVWLGTSQRALHALMCGFGDASPGAIAKAEAEVARAQEETCAAIARLGEFM